MAAVGNLLWFIFGGFELALIWLAIGCFFYLTIIGIPIGRACFEFAKLSAFPYGKEIIRAAELMGKQNVSLFSRVIHFVLNLIWLPIGVILTICHLLLGILYAVTIIGIPVAVVHLRMGRCLLAPVGCRVVSKEQALASQTANELEKRLRN